MTRPTTLPHNLPRTLQAIFCFLLGRYGNKKPTGSSVLSEMDHKNAGLKKKMPLQIKGLGGLEARICATHPWAAPSASLRASSTSFHCPKSLLAILSSQRVRTLPQTAKQKGHRKGGQTTTRIYGAHPCAPPLRGQLRRCAAPLFTFGCPAESVEPQGSNRRHPKPKTKNPRTRRGLLFFFLAGRLGIEHEV